MGNWSQWSQHLGRKNWGYQRRVRRVQRWLILCTYQPCSLCPLSKIAQCTILALMIGNGHNVGGGGGGSGNGSGGGEN